MRYSDVILTLIRTITCLYMKFSEINQVASGSMFQTMSSMLETMDKKIVENVHKEICADLNLVAKKKCQFRLM